jgi:tetratricopeptide (TPR) repeat protein
MSTKEEVVADEKMMCCASCGQAEIDDIKLKKCPDCDLVKYYSDGCQEKHREQHDEYCKKRAAELRDRDLFTPPEESHLGECPICCLPLPLDHRKSALADCCSKLLCNGCNYANKRREVEAGLKRRCVYCREPLSTTYEEVDKRRMNRIKKNCPVAMCQMGLLRRDNGDYDTALKYFTKAAELGNADAHFHLSVMYRLGQGVEMDMKKECYHLEQAAIRGHPAARHNLGVHDSDSRRYDRAKKHLIIAANLGYQDSLEVLRILYASGKASKEEYAGALRAYQAAVDETKSEEREKAEEAVKNGRISNGRTRRTIY